MGDESLIILMEKTVSMFLQRFSLKRNMEQASSNPPQKKFARSTIADTRNRKRKCCARRQIGPELCFNLNFRKKTTNNQRTRREKKILKDCQKPLRKYFESCESETRDESLWGMSHYPKEEGTVKNSFDCPSASLCLVAPRKSKSYFLVVFLKLFGFDAFVWLFFLAQIKRRLVLHGIMNRQRSDWDLVRAARRRALVKARTPRWPSRRTAWEVGSLARTQERSTITQFLAPQS